MKQLLFGLLLISFSLNSCGQNPENSTDITNKLTEKHVRIPGSHVYLIPPEKFTNSSTFIGLTNSVNTNISIMDIVGGNIFENAKDFSKETFEQKGLTIYEYKKFKINNWIAKLMYTNSANSSEKNLILIFGDSTFSAMINATFYSDAEKMLDKVKNSLLSVVYDKKVKVNPFEVARFNFDLTKSEYKFDQSLPGGQFVFSTDTVKNKPKTATSFIVVQMPYQDATDEMLTVASNQIMESAKKYGNNDLRLETKKAKINGYNSIETFGFGNKNGSKILYYLLVVGKTNNVTAINSIIQSDYESNLKKLIEVTHSIKLK